MPSSDSRGDSVECHLYDVQAIVNSVGPYRFSRALFGAAVSQVSAQLIGRGSPQNKLSRSEGKLCGFRVPNCFINAIVEGTENHTVNRLSRMNCAGLINDFCDGQKTHAPRSQDTNMSKADKSKVKSNICETASCSVISNPLV